MVLYHASKEIVEFPEVRKTRYTKDFSWGFYCTNNFRQAVWWANRGSGERDAEMARHINMTLWRGQWQMIRCGIM